MIERRRRSVRVAAILIISLGAAFSRCVAARDILFLGNSITHHGPDASIQWSGDWGMAASRADLDFVNQTAGLMQRATDAAISWRVLSSNPVEQEFFELSPARVVDLVAGTGRPAIIVVQIGDNVDLTGDRHSSAQFGRQYAVLLAGLRQRFGTAARLACISKWWPSPPIDGEIRAACAGAGGSYVDISDVYPEPWSNASSERPIAVAGVGAHPGDRAMREIAARLAAALTHPSPAVLP